MGWGWASVTVILPFVGVSVRAEGMTVVGFDMFVVLVSAICGSGGKVVRYIEKARDVIAGCPIEGRMKRLQERVG